MSKIVVTQDLGLNKEERERLNKLGEVIYYENLSTTLDEWFSRCKDADIICTGRFGFASEKLYELENKFFSCPIVGVGFLNLEKLKEKNILVARAPGCNSEAVSEWVIAMVLNLFRDLLNYVNNLSLPVGVTPERTKGLVGKNITILGKGNIGLQVGKICEDFGMNVKYFIRNDDLVESIKNADVVVNTLSLNKETTGLLDKQFFNSFKKGAYFITITSIQMHDTNAILEALDKNILAGVANDCGSIQNGDVLDLSYMKFAKHPKVLATPHISYNTDTTDRKGSKMMIDNIEAYLKDKPINLIK